MAKRSICKKHLKEAAERSRWKRTGQKRIGQKEGEPENMKSRRKYAPHRSQLVIILSVLFCLLVALGAGYYIKTRYQPLAVQTGPQPLVAEGNVKTGTLYDPEKRQEELNSVVEEGMLAFSINATPFMKNGKAKANLMVENPPNNGKRFTVTIQRDDTGEKIYESGYLDPEQYIDEVPLDVELEQGEYACTAYIDAYRISDNGYIGRAGAQITLYVLE